MGWRGWLLPALLPLGQWRALVVSGALWGAWHAPLVALGYDYPQHHVLGPLLMVVFCVIIGIILGWTRLATGSIWPAVIGHATINATGRAHSLLGPAGSFDTAQATFLGWSGWLLPIAFIVWLAVTRRLPVATAEYPLGSHRPDTSAATAQKRARGAHGFACRVKAEDYITGSTD